MNEASTSTPALHTAKSEAILDLVDTFGSIWGPLDNLRTHETPMGHRRSVAEASRRPPGEIWSHLESPGTIWKHPGHTQEVPKRHPAATQEAPRRHPRTTQEPQKKAPGRTQGSRGHFDIFRRPSAAFCRTKTTGYPGTR